MRMIEQIVREYLSERMDCPVYLERPSDPPESYVTVEKTGSSVRNHIYHATIALQSIAPTMYQASSINESIKYLMDGIVALNDIAGIRLNSDYNFTNTSTRQRRYQAVFDITHYQLNTDLGE